MSQINKVPELFYTDQIENDLLALDIIKNENDKSVFVLPLIIVFLNPRTFEIKREAFKLIQPFLTKEQYEYLKRRENESVGPASIAMNFRDAYTTFYTLFSAEQNAELFYHFYKRAKFGVEKFLMFDKQKNHPKRTSAFKNFIEVSIKRRTLYFFDFLPEETDRYLNQCFSAANSEKYDLYIYDEESLNFPQQLFLHDYKSITIFRNIKDSELTSFVFRFKKATKLKLRIDEDIELPADWSGLESLQELSLGGKGKVFNNFNFIKTLPAFQKLNIGSNLYSHPDILFECENILFEQRPVGFESTEGYDIKIDVKRVLDIYNALSPSDISQKQKKDLFKTLLRGTSFEELSNRELVILNSIELSGDSKEEIKYILELRGNGFD